MLIESFALTDTGKIRKNNEDSFFIQTDIPLFIVADGMGGHNSGEIASRMAIDIISNNFYKLLQRKGEGNYIINKNFNIQTNYLISSIQIANQAIFEASNTYSQNKGMGTTVVALHISQNIYSIAWVGDSRVYLIRHNQIQQLTTDHSLIQEQISQGILTPSEAETSEFKNVLTRALGTSQKIDVDALELNVFDNDIIILCSDGLTRMLQDEIILNTTLSLEKPQDISKKLIELANLAGGKDNITVITVKTKSQNLLNRFLKKLKKVT